ncbi:MAG TPA: secondary thiamine-phosphate synthase enzyme YjbQ [Gemmatimonadales bacterium]|nr:secondary thiamine-phosphate synthase enzyme YjbQ [Gemmatimonadales bacterium]
MEGVKAASPAFSGYDARRIDVDTLGKLECHDITDPIENFISESAAQNAMVLVQALHTSAGLLVNEWETGLRKDLVNAAERLVPSGIDYTHDDMSVRWENICPEDAEWPNGHSHLQNAVLGTPTLMLPAVGGRLMLGRWQGVLLVEFDHPRPRTVMVHLFGMPGVASPLNANGNGARAYTHESSHTNGNGALNGELGSAGGDGRP